MDQPMPGKDPLDFEKAQFEEGDSSELSCEYCKRAIADMYFDLNGGMTTCDSCRRQMEHARTAGTPLGRFLRSLLFGGIGGAIGAAIYYAVLALTDYEIGLIALLVGFLVGVGVRIGSGGAGGRGYQLLAAAMTYVAIVSTYIPFILEAMANSPEMAEAQAIGDAGVLAAEEPPGTVPEGEEVGIEPVAEEASVGMLVLAIAFVVLFAMATPFLAGIGNLIGILIIGFAVYAAWQMNAYQPFVVEGPFRVGESAEPT